MNRCENGNYTAMNTTCTGSGSKSHTCTLNVSDALVASVDAVYVGCEDANENVDRANATAMFLMDITSLAANNSGAMDIGIKTSVIWPGATIYTDQQVFLRNISNDQVLATVDKVAVSGNRRWILNNGIDGEQQLGLFNISPIVYVLDLINTSFEDLSRQVSTLINATKS